MERPRTPASGLHRRVVICTFNRVEECLKSNVVDDPDRAARPHRSRHRPGHGPARVAAPLELLAAALGSRLHYVRQPNLGGAGGFTRGLFDATTGSPDDQADVLLDDDLFLEPELIVQAGRLRRLPPSGRPSSAARCSTSSTRTISAEKADPERLAVGIAVRARCRRPTCSAATSGTSINQERRVDTEYNGWWAC